jgi:hypothetical protein
MAFAIQLALPYIPILLILILYFLYIYLDIEHLQETFENNMRILHLVLYSKNDAYDKMHDSTSALYKDAPNVDTYYYCFSPDIQNDYELSGDILFIKGEETFLPGILEKTLKAFEYFKDELPKYTHVVRSNISTVIDFKKLKRELAKEEINYGGGVLINLTSISLPYGTMRDPNWMGTTYSSGTAIIFSSKTVQNMLKQMATIPRDVIDDVALGIYIREQEPEIEPKNIGKWHVVPDMSSEKPEEMEKMIHTNDFIFYRNNNGNRELDAEQMKKIVRILSESSEPFTVVKK